MVRSLSRLPWQRYPRTSARGYKLQAKLSRNLLRFATTKNVKQAVSSQLGGGKAINLFRWLPHAYTSPTATQELIADS
jgi:hypothetical protein